MALFFLALVSRLLKEWPQKLLECLMDWAEATLNDNVDV